MDPFLGEIRLFSGSFAPKGWALCQGQLLPISQNTALFSLLGTAYGGDGRSTFGLPNLAGRVALGQGQASSGTSYNYGQTGGETLHQLTNQEIPPHVHILTGDNSNANNNSPSGNLVGKGQNRSTYLYSTSDNVVTMAASAVGASGNGEGHETQQPFLTVNYIIALAGIFPTRS